MEDEKKYLVDESIEYDNFIGKMNEEDKPASLASFLDTKETDDNVESWKKHWKNMPEFVQEANEPYKRLTLSFRTKEDYEKFAKLIDQKLTEKTKSIWYPALDRTGNSLLRWIEE